MKTGRDRIIARIRSSGHGNNAFSAKDFLDICSRFLVDKTLSNLVKDSTIRRIARGLYDYPQKSELLGEELPPDMDQAAQAIARKHRWTIAPDTAMAANMLGLSQQVPAKVVYLSDGPSRQLKVSDQTITFRHTNPKDLRLENYSSRVIAQALRFLGKDNVDWKVISLLRRKLPKQDKANFIKDARYGTDWIFDVAQKIQRDDHE